MKLLYVFEIFILFEPFRVFVGLHFMFLLMEYGRDHTPTLFT